MTHDDSLIDDIAPENELDTDVVEETSSTDDFEDEKSSTEEPDFFGDEAANFLGDDNMNPYLTDEMTDFLNDRITDYSAIGKNAGKQNITAGKISIKSEVYLSRLQKKMIFSLNHMEKSLSQKLSTIVHNVRNVVVSFVNRFWSKKKL